MKRVITESDVKSAKSRGEGTIELDENTVATPSAIDVAKALGITLRQHVVQPHARLAGEDLGRHEERKVVALASDHGGFHLKKRVKAYLSELGYAVSDFGCTSEDAVDYPDFAVRVADAVSRRRAWRGIVVDGAGIGSAIVANKLPRVRAAACYDVAGATNSREHNDANVLTLGAGRTEESMAKEIVKVWLETDFGGGRHARRVKKIDLIENKYLRK